MVDKIIQLINSPLDEYGNYDTLGLSESGKIYIFIDGEWEFWTNSPEHETKKNKTN